jgi:Trk-type K+ transport system membrane component
MKPLPRAVLLVAMSLFCLYGFAWLTSRKGIHFSSTVDSIIAALILFGAVALPLLGYLNLRRRQSTEPYQALLFPTFLISLSPAVIILSATLVGLLSCAP